MLTIRIPGQPHCQGRPRFRRFKTATREFVSTYDPAASRSWKGAAQVHMQEALRAAGAAAPFVPVGPAQVRVLAVFPCPTSEQKKRTPVPRRPHAKRGDADNIAKAVKDAANGILWLDDGQVARLVVEKWIGAQGEAPYVEVTVEPLA